MFGCTEVCTCDYVEVRQGPSDNGNLIGRYCGNVRPSPVFSPVNQMLVGFTADSQYTRQGFSASYMAVPPDQSEKTKFKTD